MKTEPVLFTLQDASRTFGIGLTRLYSLIGEGRLDAKKFGKRTLVSAESLRAFVESLPSAVVRAGKRAA